MKCFEYIVKEELGLHARPAGLLVKEAKKIHSRITIQKEGRQVLATQLMKLLQLNVKKGDTIIVTVEGDDEENAAVQIENFIKENL